MILVDTSVLIDYFRESDNEKTLRFKMVMDNNIPFGINHVIYMELLRGAKTSKDFRLLKQYLDTQRFFDLKHGRESYARAAKLYFELRRTGRAVRSAIDCLIAETAIENNLFLLHNDADFTRIGMIAPLKEY